MVLRRCHGAALPNAAARPVDCDRIGEVIGPEAAIGDPVRDGVGPIAAVRWRERTPSPRRLWTDGSGDAGRDDAAFKISGAARFAVLGATMADANVQGRKTGNDDLDQG